VAQLLGNPESAMTPDTKVWINTPRNGIGYHLIAEDGRKTVCGRYIGMIVDGGGTSRGHVMLLAETVDRFGSKPCQHCTGVSELVDPVKGRLWTS
jgi:hypothetical protein